MRELAWEIAETYRTMRRFYDRRASSIGVTHAQWRVLVLLSIESGLKQVELAERLDVEPITAGRMVDRLAEAGLVERRPVEGDRRAWKLVLTPKAEPILARLRALAEDAAADAFAGLSEEEFEEMRARLALIRENIGRLEAAQRVSA